MMIEPLVRTNIIHSKLSITLIQVVNNNQHFLCKLQDYDTLRSYEMTAIFQEKTIANFPPCHLPACTAVYEKISQTFLRYYIYLRYTYTTIKFTVV